MWQSHYLLIFFCVLIVILSHDNVQAEAKKFMRCELTRELLQKYQFSKTFISNWICLIEHESFLDTKKVSQKTNGIAAYGLFQIDNKEWCRKERKGGLCNKKCEDFLDDNISDDVECARRIFDRDGFKHWQGWNTSCRNTQNLPNLKIACNIEMLTATRAYGT